MEPRVENLPLPLDRSLYQEAVDTYLELSHKYIEALYLFGNIRYPGLSDLDLLVVPKDSYLAPLHLHLRDRLPRRFDPILEHDVFVVPQSQLGACRYRLSSPCSLAYGRDVLAGITVERSVAARVCDALEGVNIGLEYLAQLKRTGILSARSCTRVFNSQRYKVRRLADLGLVDEGGYGATIDALRARLMAAPTPECVLEMYHAFERSVTTCARAVDSSLGLDAGSFARIADICYGHVPAPFEAFEMEDARRRAEVIRAYRQELVTRNYWYGFWFMHRFFPATAARPPWHRVIFRGLRSGSRRWHRLRSSLRMPPGSRERAPARSLPQPG